MIRLCIVGSFPSPPGERRDNAATRAHRQQPVLASRILRSIQRPLRPRSPATDRTHSQLGNHAGIRVDGTRLSKRKVQLRHQVRQDQKSDGAPRTDRFHLGVLGALWRLSLRKRRRSQREGERERPTDPGRPQAARVRARARVLFSESWRSRRPWRFSLRKRQRSPREGGEGATN
jgi:hypothetical protein